MRLHGHFDGGVKELIAADAAQVAGSRTVSMVSWCICHRDRK